jgi:hypothetical protein
MNFIALQEERVQGKQLHGRDQRAPIRAESSALKAHRLRRSDASQRGLNQAARKRKRLFTCGVEKSHSVL